MKFNLNYIEFAIKKKSKLNFIFLSFHFSTLNISTIFLKQDDTSNVHCSALKILIRDRIELMKEILSQVTTIKVNQLELSIFFKFFFPNLKRSSIYEYVLKMSTGNEVASSLIFEN